jgi:hypothetical protein
VMAATIDRAAVPRAQVDDLEAVRFLAVGEHCEAIVAPDLVLGGLFRVLDLRLEIRPVTAVKVAAEGAVDPAWATSGERRERRGDGHPPPAPFRAQVWASPHQLPPGRGSD